MIITANDVKTKGVSFFGKMFEKADELVILAKDIVNQLRLKQSTPP